MFRGSDGRYVHSHYDLLRLQGTSSVSHYTARDVMHNNTPSTPRVMLAKWGVPDHYKPRKSEKLASTSVSVLVQMYGYRLREVVAKVSSFFLRKRLSCDH